MKMFEKSNGKANEIGMWRGIGSRTTNGERFKNIFWCYLNLAFSVYSPFFKNCKQLDPLFLLLHLLPYGCKSFENAFDDKTFVRCMSAWLGK